MRLVDNRRHAAPSLWFGPPVEPGDIRRFRGGSQGNPYPVHKVATDSIAPALQRDAAEAQHLPMAHDNYIAGKWVPARSGRTDAVLDPATGEQIAEVPSSDAADVDAAVTAAAAAFPEWSATTPQERAEALLKFADRIEEHGDELVAARVAERRQADRGDAATRCGSPPTTCDSSPARRAVLDGQRDR